MNRQGITPEEEAEINGHFAFAEKIMQNGLLTQLIRNGRQLGESSKMRFAEQISQPAIRDRFFNKDFSPKR